MSSQDAVSETTRSVSSTLTPLMLNHAAWVTHDVEATAKFYTKIMGMTLASTVYGDRIPSTGDDFPYFHIFFRMQDGSTIAFFEVPGLPPRNSPSHAAYEIFDHIALQAADRDEVDRWHVWLTKNGVDVLGPTNHDGLIYSVYFRDPNGIRLEITTPLNPDWNRHEESAARDLENWSQAKRNAAASGRTVQSHMGELISRNHPAH